jgi:hypothetical protein
MQRSFIALLKGEFVESIILYPALIPTIFLFLYTFSHLVFKFKNGANIIKLDFFLIVILTLGNYFYKILSTNL